MTKEDHIKYWTNDAERNWETASYLKQGKQNVMALFMLHLVVEKLLKAHWVKDNVDNTPPRTHDLQLLFKQSELSLSTEHYDYLSVINQWNIDTRYPDYKNKVYQIATELYLENHFTKVSELRECLLEKL
jgi:HEPN domain-containing protein